MIVIYLIIAPIYNYAKEKRVVDHKKPLYSGHGCKQWLSSIWSCRMTQRTNFSYEKVSWQPKDCQMEEFEGSKFLKSTYQPQNGTTVPFRPTRTKHNTEHLFNPVLFRPVLTRPVYVPNGTTLPKVTLLWYRWERKRNDMNEIVRYNACLTT
ncbi:hypothetical protein DVH24_039387 [Malus domestica]|uniref:Trichome birefringence-like N-terminal domain-containing protein n=1 Tax=Malus domestica TaxID=3750 RepID=A0A498HVR9_MALDO|nr:hypothetical protein DVH24_039387 [Malus domestica]